jgi:hypothetical protein
MFDEGQGDLFEVDMSFVDEFVIGQDVILGELQRLNFTVIYKNLEVNQFTPNMAIVKLYRQETIRTSREDTRFDEEILRSDKVICNQVNIDAEIRY